jgi:hypothetical protein
MPDFQRSLKAEVKRLNDGKRDVERQIIESSSDAALQRSIEIAALKTSSTWLTALPIDAEELALHKTDRDALRIRYGLALPNIPMNCVCGATFDLDHALTCKKGGFIHKRHDEVRDFLTRLISVPCFDVAKEPPLQPLDDEPLAYATANISENARLDISARNFWNSSMQRAFFDVRVFHPNAPSYRTKKIAALFREQENEKKRQYNQRVIDIEGGSFTPLVFGSMGGTGKECDKFLERLADLLSTKTNSDYSKTIAWIRCKLSILLVRSALVCLRGTRKWYTQTTGEINPEMSCITARI